MTMGFEAAKPGFSSDYMEGAHPEILKRLVETNFIQTPGYGTDAFSEDARERIRAACKAPDAEIHFLAGGTQANAVVLSAMLRPWQGVLTAETGHICGHEAGAIELGGHKVLPLPQHDGKLRAEDAERAFRAYELDENRDHIVMPGAVYLSQPTEAGTLYSLAELESISAVCRAHGAPLYLDGARLAYALACPENDASLEDIARLCDCFYIGGTKCGALFGEAVVFPKKGFLPHFFTIVKQRGALLAKGRAAAIQFEVLFTDGLYLSIGKNAIGAANRIRAALREKGYAFAWETPTNQIFLSLDDAQLARLTAAADLGFWERRDDGRTVMRIATSWATRPEAVDALIAAL